MGVSRRMLKVALTVGALATALVAGIPAGQASAVDTGTLSYLAVIDAGSSGTRLTLFKDDPTDLHPIEAFKVKVTTPGLSSFADTPGQSGPGAVEPLLRQLDAYLGERGIARESVPVALLATAGMRNVRRDDPDASRSILQSTAAAIAASGHPTADNRILPAVQESTLAWLDTNVIAGTLNKPGTSVGIIEIGGASAQVAFLSPRASGRAVHEVRVAGSVIPVVAVSYLGLGGNDARTAMQRDNDAGAFCFPNNASGQRPDVYLDRSPRPVDASTAMYSWIRCTGAYDDVISRVGAQRTASATVPPDQLRDLPGFAGTFFVGLGSIPYSFATLGIENERNERTALRTAVQRVCSGTNAWDTVRPLYAAPSSAQGETLCSTTSYQYEFVFGPNGVGAPPSRFTTIEVDLPKSPSWTAGYAITLLDP